MNTETREQTKIRHRILIADDEAGVRRFMRDSLSGSDYEILEANDGRSIIRIVATTPIDLIITDVCMPEKDGLETIQELRQLNSHAKILAISGAFDGLFLNAARVFGADATLEKPFGPLELKQCVGRLLDAA